MTSLLIAGATGLVGKLVLEQALADDRVSRVVALTRRLIAPRDKLENVVIDFADIPGDAAWWSVDGVICALGTTRAQTSSPALYRAIDHDYPLAIARHARDHDAARFALVSSLGADPKSRFAYTRLKGELERDVKTLGYPSLTIVRPSFLAGPRDQVRSGERMAEVLLGTLAPLIPRRLRFSPASRVAAAVLDGAIDAPPGTHILHNQDMG